MVKNDETDFKQKAMEHNELASNRPVTVKPAINALSSAATPVIKAAATPYPAQQKAQRVARYICFVCVDFVVFLINGKVIVRIKNTGRLPIKANMVATKADQIGRSLSTIL